MKLAKMMIGTLLFVPAMAIGIAQQDPAQPAQPNQLQEDPATQTQPDSASQQNLQQDSAATQPGMEQEVIGTIEEVRDDSFSVKKDSDQSVVWFTITPELKSSYSAELVTGNHVRVMASPGDSPDRMAASSVMAEAGDATAAADTTDPSAADTQADLDTDTDVDADVDVDSDSATATLDTDTSLEESDTQIAQTETDSSLRQDDSLDTSDELPRTASSLPSIGVLGLLAVVGAAAVAFARKF